MVSWTKGSRLRSKEHEQQIKECEQEIAELREEVEEAKQSEIQVMKGCERRQSKIEDLVAANTEQVELRTGFAMKYADAKVLVEESERKHEERVQDPEKDQDQWSKSLESCFTKAQKAIKSNGELK